MNAIIPDKSPPPIERAVADGPRNGSQEKAIATAFSHQIYSQRASLTIPCPYRQGRNARLMRVGNRLFAVGSFAGGGAI